LYEDENYAYSGLAFLLEPGANVKITIFFA
jgi:hypothetical protein